MQQRIYLIMMAFVLAGAAACSKKETPKPLSPQPAPITAPAPPDHFAKMAGDWTCNGENNAAHVAFSSQTEWAAEDTAIVLTGFTVRIEKMSDVSLKVICMGYNQYMAYADLGITFEKCATTADSNKVEFRDGRYDPYTGYGGGSSIAYYIKQDSIRYSSVYRSNTDRYDVVMNGRRK